MKLLVIIPAYNEAESILNTVRSLRRDCPWADYLVVNDGSSDGTEDILRREGLNHVTLPINLGIGGAVQTGYRYAVAGGYDAAVQFDGDGQHNAVYIPALLAPIERGEADLVTGSRFIEGEGFQTSFMRRLGGAMLRGAIRLCAGVRVTDPTSGFRAVSAPLAAFYAENYAQDYPEPEAIMAAALGGFRIREAPVIMNERSGGTSSINPLRSAYYMIKVTLAIFSYRLVGARRGRDRS